MIDLSLRLALVGTMGTTVVAQGDVSLATWEDVQKAYEEGKLKIESTLPELEFKEGDLSTEMEN